jgi:hypothetical protein
MSPYAQAVYHYGDQIAPPVIVGARGEAGPQTSHIIDYFSGSSAIYRLCYV